MNELLALAVLAGFVLASTLLIAGGGTRLHRLWWVGSLASGLVVAGLATSLDFSLPPLPGPQLPRPGVLAMVGALGFLGGTDVQALIGIALRRDGSLPAVLAGAILGPMLIVGGYWLLVRVGT